MASLWYGPSGTCDVEADLEPGYHLVWRWDGAVNVGLRGLGVAKGSRAHGNQANEAHRRRAETELNRQKARRSAATS